jgi:hypothetical protein
MSRAHLGKVAKRVIIICYPVHGGTYLYRFTLRTSLSLSLSYLAYLADLRLRASHHSPTPPAAPLGKNPTPFYFAVDARSHSSSRHINYSLSNCSVVRTE